MVLFLFYLFIYLLTYLFIYLFIFGCVGSLLLCAGFLQLQRTGFTLLGCAGFSLRWLLLLWSMGSRPVGFSSCGLKALERRLSSCGARAQLLRGMWDLPRPGLEPMSPALAGGFSTTVPPGKPQMVLKDKFYRTFKDRSLPNFQTVEKEVKLPSQSNTDTRTRQRRYMKGKSRATLLMTTS